MAVSRFLPLHVLWLSFVAPLTRLGLFIALETVRPPFLHSSLLFPPIPLVSLFVQISLMNFPRFGQPSFRRINLPPKHQPESSVRCSEDPLPRIQHHSSFRSGALLSQDAFFLCAFELLHFCGNKFRGVPLLFLRPNLSFPPIPRMFPVLSLLRFFLGFVKWGDLHA